jgi:hypothetical protein
MAVFCSPLISFFPGTLLRYFLNDFEMNPVVPISTGITFFTFNMRCLLLLLLLLNIDVGQSKYLSGHILFAGFSSYTLGVGSLTVLVITNIHVSGTGVPPT